MSLISEMREYTKAHNWDDDQGMNIPDSSWDEAERLLSIFRERKWPAPFVSPCGDGTIHFAWSRPDATRGVLEVFWPRPEYPGIQMWWTEAPMDGELVISHIMENHEQTVLRYIENFLGY